MTNDTAPTDLPSVPDTATPDAPTGAERQAVPVKMLHVPRGQRVPVEQLRQARRGPKAPRVRIPNADREAAARAKRERRGERMRREWGDGA